MSMSISIHILDDDSLLNVFHLYRLIILNEDKTDGQQIFEGKWVRERWWYKFAHICQRWRSLILGSASYLDLCLVCTHRTPIADMITHSPPLPLLIDYLDEYYQEPANYEDEAGILIVLQQRDRVRRIRLGVSASYLKRFISAIDEEFPMLEYLWIMPMDMDDWNTNEWILPTTFQAPRLRHLILSDFALPIRSPLLTTEAGLVTLTLQSIDQSSYFSPNDLLQQLSLMHHLQSFAIDVPYNDVKELRKWLFGDTSSSHHYPCPREALYRLL
ncbi:hypothetical protein BC827DRAFT_1201694 [Russula dissimulans]|nr:hypothetical protein BC827DRAFT_1201694 [Russula dissimulans]